MPGPDLAASCWDVTLDYQSAAGPARALTDVEASFPRNRLTVVAGPSGSGKSSLLRVLAGVIRPSRGSVLVDGVDLTRLGRGGRRRLRRRAMGVVLQDPADNLLEYLGAREQVELGARLRGADPSGATALLEAVGLGHRLDATPPELSGGEQQRVAFAAAAIGAPAVLLADEPTAQLDGESAAALVEAMRGLVDLGATLVVASHDPVVIDGVDERVHLRDGEVVDR